MQTRRSFGIVALTLLMLTLSGIAHAESVPVPTPNKKAPEWASTANNWINTSGKALHLYGKNGINTSGQVTVLTFWTHGCINCKRTIPFWNDWAKRYAPKQGQHSDVALISVHTPELDYERKPANVRRFVQDKGIVFPVAIDNDMALWNAYHVQAWPTTILIDKHGQERYRWEGELNYGNSGDFKKVEQQIEQLRKER